MFNSQHTSYFWVVEWPFSALAFNCGEQILLLDKYFAVFAQVAVFHLDNVRWVHDLKMVQ